MTTQSADAQLVEEIIDLLAAERAMKRSKIKLTSELNNDLGMDGDDAVEFFETFSKRFSVDLEELNVHWEQHFAPEGGGPGLGFMILTGVAVVLAGLLHEAVSVIPMWASYVGVLSISFVAYFYLAGRNAVRASGVTVQDLIDAAKAHRWVKSYNNDPRTISGYEL